MESENSTMFTSSTNEIFSRFTNSLLANLRDLKESPKEHLDNMNEKLIVNISSLVRFMEGHNKNLEDFDNYIPIRQLSKEFEAKFKLNNEESIYNDDENLFKDNEIDNINENEIMKKQNEMNDTFFRDLKVENSENLNPDDTLLILDDYCDTKSMFSSRFSILDRQS